MIGQSAFEGAGLSKGSIICKSFLTLTKHHKDHPDYYRSVAKCLSNLCQASRNLADFSDFFEWFWRVSCPSHLVFSLEQLEFPQIGSALDRRFRRK